jgi:hypothetical protein
VRSSSKEWGGNSVIDLNLLLQRLCDADGEFVIVGGFAAMLHVPRC